MISDGDDPGGPKLPVPKFRGPSKGPTDRSRITTLITEFAPQCETHSDGDELQAIVTVLSGTEAGTSHSLDRPQTYVGRDGESSITLNDPGMSRIHARFVRAGSAVYVEDLKSTNGTLVNGQRIHQPHRLSTGDRIQVGQSTILRFALQDRLEQEAHQRIYEMTVRDGLTHLHNRRYLDDRLEAEYAYSIRHESPLCILMLDVDHFKKVNDTYGHAAGDQVLCAVARALEHTVRAEDLAARYGGEEFVVLARGIDSRGALAFAERIRAHLEGMQIQTAAGVISITASLGVSHIQTRAYQSSYGLLSAADEALYCAKRDGRNRVVLADPSRGTPGHNTKDWQRKSPKTGDGSAV